MKSVEETLSTLPRMQRFVPRHANEGRMARQPVWMPAGFISNWRWWMGMVCSK